MRNSSLVLYGLCLTIAAGALLVTRLGAQQETTATPTLQRRPVVVELFTSEGCSSCPPADLLLQKLVAQQPVAGAEVIALEEHVDYWNHEGWTDPYSSHDWTLRQQDYAALFKGDPYTPQAVVDGHSAFVGNNGNDASRLIESAAAREKAQVKIAAEQTDSKSSKLHISVAKLPGTPSGDMFEVWLAVTEDDLHSSVSAGENAGHMLPHVATLRSLRKIGVAEANTTAVSYTGDPVVKLDRHWNVGKLHFTAFVQRKKSREIVGAASAAIANNPSAKQSS